MREIVLITVAGPDKPGVTASINDILARYHVDILDIGQSVIYESLTLGILIELSASAAESSMLKELLFRAHELGVQVKFQPVSRERYETWVSQQAKSRYIVTLLARRITSAQIAAVTSIIAYHGFNIENVTRLSDRAHFTHDIGPDSKACVEFEVEGEPSDLDGMRAEFLQVSQELEVDIAFQKDNAYRRNRRLVVFDMDSTLIEAEVIDELAKAAGVGEKVAAITERAMRGELDFQASFRERVALLKGLDATVLNEVGKRLPLTEGAERLVKTLKALGYKTAILSGGFTYFGRLLQKKLGIDYVYANELEIRNGLVTGNVVGQVVDGARKAALLREIAESEGLNLEQVIAVGDGANDLPMLSIAGLGIAFRAKPLVKENAKQAISTLGLDGILYLIGVRDRDSFELFWN